MVCGGTDAYQHAVENSGKREPHFLYLRANPWVFTAAPFQFVIY